MGVDEFDDLIMAMRAHSQKERHRRITKRLPTKSVDEFDEFISFLRSPTPVRYMLPKTRSQEEYENFLTILATPTGSTDASGTLLPNAEENDVMAFASFLKGGPLPPRASGSGSSTTSSARPSVVPVDYITKETKRVRAEKEAARLAKWESEADVAILYFTKKALAEKDSANRGNYAEDELPIALKHFADAAHRAKNDIGSDGEVVEEMPIAFQHFSLPAYEKSRAERAKREYENAHPPPMPIAMEYFTQPAREAKARQRAEIRAMIDNPPPMPIAMQHFSAIESAKKESEREHEPEIAMRHFAALAAADRARRASGSGGVATLDETPIAMRHFADVDARRKEARMNASTPGVTSIVVPEPVPVDYFNRLYAAEREAKIAESRNGVDDDVPIAIRHFTGEVGSSSSTKRSGGNVPYEEMLPAHRHFNPPKDTSKDGDEARTENLPIAIQRFTMAAYEEKQRMKAVGSAGGDDGPSVAHLHFTPGLSLKQIVTAE